MTSRTKRPRSKLAGIEQNLADILGEESLEQLMGLAKLRRAWPDIVGPMMATRTEPVQLEHIADAGFCLWVAVDHSIMAQQIRFLRDDIRLACTRLTGIGNLHQIRSRTLPGAGIKPRKAKAKPAHISFREKRGVALELASIKDRSLKRAAFQARLAQIAYGEEKR